MPDVDVPDEDNVARHLANRDIQDGVLGSAPFLLGSGQEHVSVYHLEYFATDNEPEQLSCVCDHLDRADAQKLRGGRKIRPSHRFASFQVEVARAAVSIRSEGRLVLRVSKRPELGAPFHAGLFGYGSDHEGNVAADALRSVANVTAERRALPLADKCNCTTR